MSALFCQCPDCDGRDARESVEPAWLPDDQECCPVNHPHGWGCTETRGHEGPHEARSFRFICARWVTA